MKHALIVLILLPCCIAGAMPATFNGRYYSGEGDAEYLGLLDISARMMEPDPEFQNLSMLYTPSWNGLVEGPTWGAWWIQNSYGATYCGLPFWEEPYLTFLQNAQDLWFDQMGDGQRKGANDWVAPDGCLCDAAAPGWIVYKQGDGKIHIHDWGMEFTAAGIVMQAELLLISRDAAAIAHYLPMLERSANFIESRRDPASNLFLAGAAGNLLAPSYAGQKKSDTEYGMAYLTGLSITYIAALDRLVELEKLAGRAEQAALLAVRRDLARKGLTALTTDEGYFIKYLDPDGTRHGVYGAEKHGYFEAVCNHDAMAFRVVDDAQARRIYDKLAAIPGIRPHGLIITNYPGLDDMYEEPTSWLWSFGTWVNGGHWTTCEGRMLLGYSRVGAYDDIRAAMNQMMKFARAFRMDNPLVEFGNAVYQPKEPINITIDAYAAPAGMMRGLFEYLYRADALVLVPHIPPSITRLEQKLPVRFGAKRLYISTAGAGAIRAVTVNGAPWKLCDAATVTLPFAAVPDLAQIQLLLGDGQPFATAAPAATPAPQPDAGFYDLSALAPAGGNRHPVRIGADSQDGSKFIGDIRRVRLYDAALGDDAIATLAGGIKAEAGTPLMDMDFEKRDGDRYKWETSGYVRGEVPVADTPEGKVARFEGKGSVDVSHRTELMFAGAFTIDAWIRPGDLPPNGGRIVDKITAGAHDGYLFDTCPGKSLRFITEYGEVSLGAPLPDAGGGFIHVAAVCDPAAGLALYVNGNKAATAPATRLMPVDLAAIGAIEARLVEKKLTASYEYAHARLVLDSIRAIHERARLLKAGTLPALPEPTQTAADKSYVDATYRLAAGLLQTLRGYQAATDAGQKAVYAACEDLLK